jgi:hypothetical protein
MKNELEQAAAERAAKTTDAIETAIADLNIAKDSAQYCRLERQITFAMDKAEGVPLQKDGTPYTYVDANPEALDNCNRQLSTCSDLRAVWCGKTSHNGNVMYQLTYCGKRYYHYRDLVRVLGAPSQRAEKSEAAKERKAAALAAAAKAEEQAAALAAAQAQLQRLTAAIATAAKDGMTAAACMAAMDKAEREGARAACIADYHDTLIARGNSEEETALLVAAKYPTPAEIEERNSECVYDDDEESSETALQAANVHTVEQLPTKAPKGSKKAVKGSKKGNK